MTTTKHYDEVLRRQIVSERIRRELEASIETSRENFRRRANCLIAEAWLVLGAVGLVTLFSILWGR